MFKVGMTVRYGKQKTLAKIVKLKKYRVAIEILEGEYKGKIWNASYEFIEVA